MIESLLTRTPVDLDNSRLRELTKFACELAESAATTIAPYFRQPLAVDDKAPATGFDPVTIADQASEDAMRRLIKARYPEHGIYGEEHGYEAGTSGLTWVLDPIDGTRAFISGLPLWGTLIALFNGQQVVLGVMNQPFMKERYVGNRLEALCHSDRGQQPLQTRGCSKLEEAIMMTTSPDMFRSINEKSAYEQLARQVRMSRFGGDCYAYCMLASGYVDLVVEADLKPYDIQALIPLVEGAGGVISNWHGEPAFAGGQVIAAASADLHRQALSTLSVAASQ
ncbi:histidinol-phosphatase [Chromatiales bacterium (ex Bugula neritina AB1)]|nr:histidinol-phosphatase [Chromatiales bacterium (ex Bugula neritina AB1)]